MAFRAVLFFPPRNASFDLSDTEGKKKVRSRVITIDSCDDLIRDYLKVVCNFRTLFFSLTVSLS